jgi:FSR family fosmidomycin resistance protein-like MFS transporter
MEKAIAAQPETMTKPVAESDFQMGGVLTIVSGHFIHDIYTAFLSPLLPLLIDKLSLSLTQAGSLQVFMQLPSLLNVGLGWLIDRRNLRYLLIFAPAVTGTLMSALGLASSFGLLAVMLFATRISLAAFHVPAPAMIGRIAGEQVGKGMSLFMAGGELARSAGPLLLTWGLGEWQLEGLWRLAAIGWAASGVLYWRLHHVSTKSKRKRGRLREALPEFRRLFLPLVGLMLLRNPLVTGLSIFLVVMLEGEGYPLDQATLALSVWFFAGVAGALFGGTVSDRFGRKRTIATALTGSGLLLLVFLNVSGWIMIPVLVLLGFTSLSVTPVLQAVVLEQLPEHQATGNGLFMLLTFFIRSINSLLIGLMGDNIGLRTAFFIMAVLTLIAVPFVGMLPDLGKHKPKMADPQ